MKCDQSAPLTRTSGRTSAMSSRGVSSSKRVTASTAARARAMAARSLSEIMGRDGLQGDGQHAPASRLHFPAAGNEVRPIGTVREAVGEDLGEEFARLIFVKEGDGVHGGEGQSHGGALAAVDAVT